MEAKALGALLILGLAFAWFCPALIGEAFTTVPSHQSAVYPWHGVLPATSDRYAQSDQADLNAPWEALEHRAVHQGTVPEWNPFSFGGQPLLANGSSGVLYPPRVLLAAVLSPTAVHTALSFLHVAGAGLAMYLLLLELGIGVPAAVLGAVAWMFGTFTLDWIQLEVVAPIFLWLPAGILCARRAVDSSYRWVAATGIVIGFLLLGTHLPFAGVTTAAILSYGGFLAAFGDREHPGRDLGLAARGTRVARVAAAGAIGVALAGVTLVPTAYLLATAQRATIDYRTMVRLFLLAPSDLRYAFMAPPHGAGPSAEIHMHQAAFVGTLVAVAAVGGALLRRRGAGLGRALVIVTVLVAIGGPATWLAYHLIPGMQTFRPYSRLLFVTDFGTAVLGALGADWVLGHLRPRPAAVIALVAIGVTGLQLGLYGRGENPPFASASHVYPQTPLVTALTTDRSAWRILPVRYDTVHAPILYADESLVFGIPSAGGYDSVVPVRTVALWEVTQGAAPAAVVGAKGPEDYVPTWERATTRFDLLPRLGVDRIVAAPEILADPVRVTALEQAGWLRTYQGPDGVVFRWTGIPAGPHVVGDGVVVHGDLSAMEAFTAPSFDASRSVVLENGPARSGTAGGTVVSRRGINSLDVDVHSGGGYLVVPDMWDPGWSASVNGKAARVLRVNFNQQAVVVPPGTISVALRYRAPGMTLGEVLTALGVLVTAALLLVPRAPGRHFGPNVSRSRARR